MKIGELKFFHQDGSDDISDVRVNSLALQLDKAFMMLHGATYEVNISQATAVKSMTEILENKEKTVADLADKSDNNYFRIVEYF